MDVKNPYDQKMQVKPVNFENKKLSRLAKKRESSTLSGNPAKNKQLYKGYTFQTHKKAGTQWYA